VLPDELKCLGRHLRAVEDDADARGERLVVLVPALDGRREG
jgi:hypothetical protein